ncbi:4Fe-4S dicluster domain-containing protein [Patescibacteria group bacterium]|nr:4Fe-4S dicluster domain-containing protein [Patescibacteria group bacterium]
MTKQNIDILFKKILKEYQIYAPVLANKELFVKKALNIKEIDYSGRIPLNSWKQLFLPDCETLFTYTGNFKKEKANYPKVCAGNMTILDLRALGLYDLVFSEDPYYQQRRQNILVVGFSFGAPNEENFADWKVFSMKLEENILEHVPFDIFLEKDKKGNFKIYSGSIKGQELLEKYKIKEYKNIKFAGLIPEEGPDKRMLELGKSIKKSANHPLWDELDKICFACGKCSLVCPTCFCFDTEDVPDKDSVKRQRLWGNCFYPEFTAIAGGKNYTDTVKKKIKFWYDHKFSRIPAEFKVPGCVSCNRCTLVCPVGIDIIKNLNRLNSKVTKKSAKK